MAFSIMPFASTSAARQSLKPAPVLSRSSFTRCAGICIAGCCVLILFLSANSECQYLHKCLQKGPLRAAWSGPRESLFQFRLLPAFRRLAAQSLPRPPPLPAPRPQESSRQLPLRNRLPASHTARTRWCPHTPRHLQSPDLPPTSGPPPAIVDT